jgi:hypothetical protein
VGGVSGCSGEGGAPSLRRLARPSRLEVELGITARAWVNTDPVDAGTRRVVTDGLRILHDPQAIFAALQKACRQTR